ncbi:nucleotide sugar dehydrogenase [Streptomyces sp. R302]|uniref:nucleotide sugar dehydrogenase n=1 Tax=unclassified Streptomyces TaxID=2593676 RepID=UPI00145E3901|nr:MULTISPECIES: nucleotide sugar dehydrogenase [unclassified Streptomyces]NML54624.1 nucleotide sugar dehydrogenase [Streptomyces sp. R301]NML82579.1 nucleotide sugar dehydrogenase [Streptomyces sp. R302]
MFTEVAVVGLGYVGLPLARRACEAGLATVGFDVDAEVVEGLDRGRSHIEDIPDEDVEAMRAAGFRATTDPAVLAGAHTVVICVPTGLTPTGEPDLLPLTTAVRTVARHLEPGVLVCVESTSHPGTTEEIVRPLLEAHGLRVGEDFHLAYSPERIDPGNRRYSLRTTPKVVSGCTKLCAKHATAFYERLVDEVVVAAGTREAEMAKLLENSYRYVNIALVDEVALYCDRVGIDIWDVLRCADTKPFGYSAFRPGPGVGGHCIPVDPRYLMTHAAEQGFTFHTLGAARAVLDAMPEHVADRARDLLLAAGKDPAGARVTLLGVAYKADISDTRESPAYAVARALGALGARLAYHDPYVGRFEVDGVTVPRQRSREQALADSDLVVLLQEHAEYRSTDWDGADCPVLDTRGTAEGRRVVRL